MEIIFPNSIASSIEAVYDCYVIKPLKLNELLEKKQLTLEKHYDNHELPHIAKTIGCDLFIYGYFVPLPENKIRIVLSLYDSRSKTLFRFTNIGKMETEIFKIIDRITLVIYDYIDKNGLFMAKPINPGASIGLVTNLTPKELNSVYALFMHSGYSVAAIQANELNSYYSHDDDIMRYFKYISTDDNAYEIITDMSLLQVRHGTWEGQRQKKIRDDVVKQYELYDLNYRILKNNALKAFATVFPRCDYMLIVVYDSARSRIWARGIDVRSKQLIFMHSHIAAEGTSRDLHATTQQLVSIIQTPTALPQKQK